MFLFPWRSAAEEEVPGQEVPEALRPWAFPEYTIRYFLRAEPPPMAGEAGLLPEAETASAYLPLRMMAGAQTPPEDGSGADVRIEPLLLLAEDGQIEPIFVRPVRGGNEVELAFPSRLAKRRVCLYAGAAEGAATQTSPRQYRPMAMSVHVCGLIATGAYTAGGPPLSSVRLQDLRRTSHYLNVARRRNINDPDPPFEDPRERSGNPERKSVVSDPDYAAIYEGFFRAPIGGAYEFAVSTFGAACLLVDGREIACAGQPDGNRAPFALAGRLELRAGMHRLALYYAQAGSKAGLRVAWRMPGARDFITMPGQAFPRALPAVVTGVEERRGAVPFIHVELLGHYRTGAQHGFAAAQEWLQVFAQLAGPPREGATLRFRVGGVGEPRASSPGGGPAGETAAAPSGAFARLPAGTPLEIECRAGSQVLARRVLTFPTEANGGRDVLDVTGELALKAAPHFLYPDETGQFHLEAQLSPIVKVITKYRLEHGPPMPLARPLGQFRLRWQLAGLPPGAAGVPAAGPPPGQDARGPSGSASWSGDQDVTPDESGRRKIRIPLEIPPLASYLGSGAVRLDMELSVGGMPAERHVFRLLHSRGDWPGTLRARADGLEYLPAAADARAAAQEPSPGMAPPEAVLFVVPREEETAYRRFRALAGEPPADPAGRAALFLGDPLVEAATQVPVGQPLGLAALLARAMPERQWSAVCLPGPHQTFFVFRLFAAAEEWLRQTPAARRPGWVVVSLGCGDALRQTPLHDFERGLDALIDRFAHRGIRRLLFVGVVPRPCQAKTTEGYQERLDGLLRQQHLDGVDLFSNWTNEEDWERRFRLESDVPTPAYGPTPNGAALQEIVELIKER